MTLTISAYQRFIKWGLLLTLLFSTLLSFSQERYTEYEIKAGYLINITKYVNWANKPDFITIGIIGKDPFGAILEQMTDQTSGLRIQITHYNTFRDIKEDCNLLFISATYKGSISELLDFTNTMNILTIADYRPDFCAKGGMIHINAPGEKPVFDVNNLSAKACCVQIHTEFLRLARSVTDNIEHKQLPCSK